MTNLRKALTSVQTARLMGADLLASELGTTSTVLRWWQSGAPGETDKQIRELAALEKRIRAYLRSDAATRTADKPKPQYKRTTDMDARSQSIIALCETMNRRGVRDIEIAIILGVLKGSVNNWRRKHKAPSTASLEKLQRLVRMTTDLTGNERGSRSPHVRHPMLAELTARMQPGSEAERPIAMDEAVACMRREAERIWGMTG